MRLAVGCGALLMAAWLVAPPLAAQGAGGGEGQGAQGAPGTGARAALGADTALVGDVVPVAVTVTVSPEERVLWPDTLPLGRLEAENAVRVRERVDTLADGRVARTGVYRVTPWRTGELSLPGVRVDVVGGDESPRSVDVTLPVLMVASVLPPDTTGLEPRPSRDVLGANWAWGPIGLFVLLLAAVALVLIWWWRARRPAALEPVPVAPLIPPRERALAALQEARESGLVEAGEMKEFYTRWTDAVRDYAAALSPGWGEDLTTTELLARFRVQVGLDAAGELREVLTPADQVKFARRMPTRDEAVTEWETARAWVLGFEWPPARTLTEEAA